MRSQCIANVLLIWWSNRTWICVASSSPVQILLLPAEDTQLILRTVELVTVDVHHQHVVHLVTLHVRVISSVDGGVGVVVVVAVGRVAIGVMVVRFIIVGHISVHFVMGMVMVGRGMKQLEEWIESEMLQTILVIRQTNNPMYMKHFSNFTISDISDTGQKNYKIPDEKRLNILKSDEKTKYYECISSHNCV